VPTLAYLLLLLSLVANTRPAPAQKPVPIKAVTACLAVTRADLEQALGRSFSAGKEESSGAESSCDYVADGGQVTIMIHRLTEALDMPAELESLKSAIPGASLREVAGIGTRAFFLDIGDAGTQLHVIRGNRDYLLVSILGFGDATRVSAAAEKMARKALDRL
jgi:hypothetical protein